MIDKMAVEEGGKVTACGIYAGATRIFSLRQRKDYPDTPPISGPGSSSNMKRNPPSFHHLPQARGQCNVPFMLHIISRLLKVDLQLRS